MKTKILLWSVVSVLMVGIAVTAWAKPGDALVFPAVGEPQVINLDNGTKLTFLGLTTGTQQMAPGFENLPTANRLYTPDCPTMAWIKVEHYQDHDHNYTGALELLISDKARTACVSLEKSTSSNVRSGEDVQGFILRAFPRWDKDFLARVKLYRGAISKEEFVISNPAPVTVTNWTPLPLPQTQAAGDLEVTLTKFTTGVPVPYWQGGKPAPTNKLVNQCVRLDFEARQNGQAATNWNPWPVQTSDAAGNRVQGLIYAYLTNGIYKAEHDGYFYQPGLWPDEPAWKVRLEFIQRHNFNDVEIVTFTNLPVRPGSQKDADDEWAWEADNTNFTFVAQGKANGMQLKLLPPLLTPGQYSTGQPNDIRDLTVIIHTDAGFKPQGMNLTVVAATDDQGRKLSTSQSDCPWAGHYSIWFVGVRDDIKSLNLKLALHKSRFVEFTVNPTKP